MCGRLLDLVQFQRRFPRSPVRVHCGWIDIEPPGSDAGRERGLQTLRRNLRGPPQQGHVRGGLGGGGIFERGDACLMPRERYLRRDGIKCLWRLRIVGPRRHAHASGTGQHAERGERLGGDWKREHGRTIAK